MKGLWKFLGGVGVGGGGVKAKFLEAMYENKLEFPGGGGGGGCKTKSLPWGKYMYQWIFSVTAHLFNTLLNI